MSSTITEHEREAVLKRLKQIAVEFTFPKLTASQAAALMRERMVLESTLARQDLIDRPESAAAQS